MQLCNVCHVNNYCKLFIEYWMNIFFIHFRSNTNDAGPFTLKYNPKWLAILKSTNHLQSSRWFLVGICKYKPGHLYIFWRNFQFTMAFLTWLWWLSFKNLKVNTLPTKNIQTEQNYIQLNEYKTAPNFIQISQNLTSDCLLI